MMATPSTIRANPVRRRPSWCMIREITGMLVTATALAKISTNDASGAAGSPH